MTTASSAQASRPWHLWLVGGLSALWNGFGAFDFTATTARFQPYVSNLPPEMLEHVYAAPAWMFVTWGLGTWSGLIGAILLLMRNRFAVWAFALSLAVVIISTIMSLLQPPPESLGSPVFTAIIVAIAAVLLAYAYWLSRRGVLR